MITTLRDRRMAAKLTIAELMELTGIARDTIRRWETGKKLRGGREDKLLAALEEVERELPELLNGSALTERLNRLGICRNRLAAAAGVDARTIWQAEHRADVSGRVLRWIARGIKKLLAEGLVTKPRRKMQVHRGRRVVKPKVAVHLTPAALPANYKRLDLIRQRAALKASALKAS